MLKLVNRNTERFLLMEGKHWVVKSSLSTGHQFLASDPSGQICPAHPSNFTTGNPDLPLNTWKFNKAPEGQDANLEDGHVIIRCSTHDAEHARWVVEQARLGELDKEKVGTLLCEQDNGGGVLMFLLDEEVQREVSSWNKAKTLEVVPYMDEGDFLPWLYQEAVDGRCKNHVSHFVQNRPSISNVKSFSRWDKELVFDALTKEKVAGRDVIVPRRKKGDAY